jgi:hypothetical protein
MLEPGDLAGTFVFASGTAGRPTGRLGSDGEIRRIGEKNGSLTPSMGQPRMVCGEKLKKVKKNLPKHYKCQPLDL